MKSLSAGVVPVVNVKSGVVMRGEFRVEAGGVPVGWLVVEPRAAMAFWGDPPDLWWGRADRSCLYWESDEELAEWVSSVDPAWSAGFPAGAVIVDR